MSLNITTIIESFIVYSNKEPVKDLVIDEIDYHTVLDKIFDQLGGLSFQEKSMKEVKDALKDKCYLEGRDQWKIKISGKKTYIYRWILL